MGLAYYGTVWMTSELSYTGVTNVNHDHGNIICYHEGKGSSDGGLMVTCGIVEDLL